METATPKFAATAALIKSAAGEHATAAPGFTFDVVCIDKDGVEKWRDTFHNLVTTEGKNKLLSTGFDADTQITTWYLGLKLTGTPVIADTLASHASWSEFSSYTGNRQAIVFGTASAASLAGAELTYAITGSRTVLGAFVCSVATGTSGTLYSAGDFSGGSKVVAASDSLKVTPTLSFS